MAGRAMVFGQDWQSLLVLSDHADSVIAQAALAESEKFVDFLLDQLAVKIRNQIVDAFKQ